jgi:hypothetical protein
MTTPVSRIALTRSPMGRAPRAWIDVSDLRRLFAVQLISWLTLGHPHGLAWTLIAGWSWITLIAVGAIPLEVYLGIAQMTHWRSIRYRTR